MCVSGLQCEVPFKMWYLFTEKRRKERETRDRLVRTFRRLKLRQLLSKIMRFWRHQVRGRTMNLCHKAAGRVW